MSLNIRLAVIPSVLAIVACLAPVAGAEDSTALKKALEQQILAPNQSLTETKAFIDQRIIRMPEIKDRAEWEQTAARLRRDMLDQIVFRGGAAAWRTATCRVEWLEEIEGGPGYRIKKFRYEALPGMWIPGLLYQPDKLEGLVPLAVNVNGHAPEGKAVKYKQLRSINLAKRGMLVLNLEWFWMGQLRARGFSHYHMNQLDLCGASGLAPFYLAMSRAIDLGLKLEHADPKRVVVSGLSGGGWQTILISSLDERVAVANPVAGYGSFRTNIAFNDLGDSEQVPIDMGIVADYAHLTAMRAPRPTLLTYNAADDCCFKSGHTLEPLMAAARPAFEIFGAADKLRSHVNHVPGTHNFEQENREKFYSMLGDFFYADDKNFVRTEIPSEDEIKTAEQLNVTMPSQNLDFHLLAENLAKKLPRERDLPTERSAAESWQRQKREQLTALLKIPRYEAILDKDHAATATAADAYQVLPRRFKIGDWTVPAVQVDGKSSSAAKVAIVCADVGRVSMASEVQRLADAGNRVLAVDPTFWGESLVKAHDAGFLIPLFVSAIGERPLGIQAAQLAAIARWSRGEHKDAAVTLVTSGPRSGMAAMVAVAVDPAVGNVEATGAYASLKELLERDKTVEAAPELFPFGFLTEFEVKQIVALAAPRTVSFREANDRAKREMAPLTAWYALFGANFNPAPAAQ